MRFGRKGYPSLGGVGSLVIISFALLALVGFGSFPESSSAATASVCGNGVVEAGEACDDGNVLDGDCCSATCTIEETRFGDLGATACTTADGTDPCEDGIDNDGDGHVDAHDPECATLHLLQQFIFVGTDSKLSVRLGSASHVEQAPVPGRTIVGFPIAGKCDPAGICTCPNTAEFPAQPRFDCQALGRTCSSDVDCAVPPYPRGLDGAALCGAHVWFRREGFSQGPMVVLDKLELGRGFETTRSLHNIFTLISDPHLTRKVQGEAAWVGAGLCAPSLQRSCFRDADCGANERCEERLRLGASENPFVDLSGNDPDAFFTRCRALVDGLLFAEIAAVEKLPAQDLLESRQNHEKRIFVRTTDGPTRLSFSGGTHVRVIDSLALGRNAELIIEGQDDTILVMHVATKMVGGVHSKIVLTDNGTGNGSMRPWNLLWILDGEKGNASFARGAHLQGTFLYRQRKQMRAGTELQLDGAAMGNRVKVRGSAEVRHVPFTALLPTDLAISLRGDQDPAGKGLPLRYDIEVANHGPSWAPGTIADVELPANVSFIDAVASQGACVESEPGRVRCHFGSVARDATVTAALTVLVAADTDEPVVTSAAVAASVEEWKGADNTTSLTTQIFVAPPTATPTITLTPSITPTPTATATRTVTPTPTVTNTPTVTHTPTVTNTPTISSTPTVTNTPTISATPTLTGTPTQTFTPSLTATVTSTPTHTPTVTNTPTVTATPTSTSTPKPPPAPASLRLRLVNNTGALIIVELSGLYIDGPVAEGGFSESYGPFLQALPVGSFDVVVNGTFNSGLWEHRLRFVGGSTSTQQGVLAGSPPINTVLWQIEP